jgi:glc operon protein GlcG
MADMMEKMRRLVKCQVTARCKRRSAFADGSQSRLQYAQLADVCPRSSPMQQRYVLSHHDAMRIIEAVRTELDRDGRGAAVAVADEHGELVALLRTDGCPLPSLHNAIHKAFTAAREGVPSGAIGKRSREEGWPISNFGDLSYTGWGGGVPIRYNGQVVGAVGVSGLPEAEDVALAEMGVKVVGN